MSRPRSRFLRSKARQGDGLRHQIPAPCPHSPPPHGIYIDRCITYHFIYVTRLQSFKKQLNEYSFDNSTTIFDINVSVNPRCADVPPPPAHPRASTVFFALDDKFPTVRTKKEGKFPVLNQHCSS